jgi:hypothetical protein
MSCHLYKFVIPVNDVQCYSLDQLDKCL